MNFLSTIHSVLMMSFLVEEVAVAVRAITLIAEGKMLLSSPSLLKSSRKVSPLIYIKEQEHSFVIRLLINNIT